MIHTLRYMSTWAYTHLRRDEGATAVEYGIMVALIAAVIVAIVASIGGHLLDAFTVVDTELEAAG